MEIKTIKEPINDTNGYIIFEEFMDEVILIDPCNFDMINSVLKKNKTIPKLILLTHEHHDHIAALNQFRETYETILICSEFCDLGIQNSSTNFSKHFAEYLYFRGNGKKYDIEELVCQPADYTFNHKFVFYWGSHTIQMVETPGHSKGGTSIILDDKYLFCGDSLLLDYEVILRFPGGSKRSYEEITIPFYKKLDQSIMVLPGHGREFVLSQVHYLEG